MNSEYSRFEELTLIKEIQELRREYIKSDCK